MELDEALDKIPQSISKIIKENISFLEHGEAYIGAVNMLKAYSIGKQSGNFFRVLDRHGLAYSLKEKELNKLGRDLDEFTEYYFQDSWDSEFKITKDFAKDSFWENKDLKDIIKKSATNRLLEITYIDRWFMYNKLFGETE